GPTDDPTEEATEEPLDDPTEEATEEPTDDPTEEPTEEPTDDPTEEPSADGDAYVEDVQGELDNLADQADRFDVLYSDATSGDLTQAEIGDAIEELNSLAADWVEYPDVAAEIIAPEGLEDIEDAYLDLADTFGETGELWEAYWAIPLVDPGEDEALDAFEGSFADAQDGIDEVQELLDEVSGSTGPSTDDPTEEPTEDPLEDPTEEPAGDSDEYLTTVSDTAADWQDSIDRFSEIIGLGADATDAEFTELTEILVAWAEAPDVAAELDAPSGLEDVQTAFEDFADELSVASVAIADYLGTDPESPEADAAFDDFITAIENAEDLLAELDDLLADAGE
ncbi:MAG: PT domain-containing protein, partial [Thermomicrobiales bacterium]